MSNTKGRWIQKLGEERKILPYNQNFIFHPYNITERLYNTQYRRGLTDSRPLVQGAKEVRIAKDTVYGIIKGHLQDQQIVGPYLGLAAAHIPEIYAALFPHIQQQFVTCQNTRKDFKEIQQWIPEVTKAYLGNRHPKFIVEHSDIIDYMHSTNVEFSVLDMDFMCNVNQGFLADVTRGIRNCAADHSLLALWHSYGHSVTKEEIDDIHLPYLYKRLEKWFVILKMDHYRYYERQLNIRGGIPMQVDLLVLERRRNERRRRAA